MSLIQNVKHSADTGAPNLPWLVSVESRRCALVGGVGNSCFRWLSPSFWCPVLHLDHGSSLCSSSPAYGFSALGSHSRSSLRSSEAALPHLQAFQTVVPPQLFVREAQVFPVLHLVLPTQPLAQPLARRWPRRSGSPAPDRGGSPSRAPLGSGLPPPPARAAARTAPLSAH